MNRLLVVGAGASIEECRRSGKYPTDATRCFPSVRNFCAKLFDPTSATLLKATASYLQKLGVQFDQRLLEIKIGDTFTGEDIKKGPVGVFIDLEAKAPEQYNIERLCEHAWHRFGNDTTFWAAFIHDGIFLHLFAIFTEQFGLGLGGNMVAGRLVAEALSNGDVVLNLNYDIAFDLALKQAGKAIAYSPEVHDNTISIFKPHGSFNFYVNPQNGNCFFEEPQKILGSVGIPDPQGGVFFAQHGIIPPRLSKSYAQHPAAEMILGNGRPFSPRIVTFWGVGLTDSDVDLLSLYREAVADARLVEFINPSLEACENATKLLATNLTHFLSLDQWVASQNRQET